MSEDKDQPAEVPEKLDVSPVEPHAEQPATVEPGARRGFRFWGRKQEAQVAAAAAVTDVPTAGVEPSVEPATAVEQPAEEAPAVVEVPPAEGEMAPAEVAPTEDAPAEAAPAEAVPAEGDVPPAEGEVPPAEGEATADTGPVPAPESPMLAEAAPVDIDMGPERHFNWWLWGGVTLALLLVGAIGFGYWWLTMRPIAVPEVVGDQVAQATQRINDAGLRLGKVSEVATDAAPVGNVIEQNPKAGSEMKPGDTVSVVVAAPADRAKVPDVTGKAVADADAALATARLAGYRVETFSTTATVGVVIGQVPSSGALLAPGSYVALSVSKGPAPTQVIVPNLVGLNGDDAKATLEALGLKGAGYRAIEPSTTVGVVFEQNPTSATRVTPDTTVQYLISDGAGTANVTVPSLVGLTRKAAEKEIKDLGLKVSTRVVISGSVVKDNVIQQMPPSGDKVAPGTTIGLLVSKGMITDAPVPDLVGKSSSEASKAIAAAGFKPVVLEVAVEGQTPARVFAQFPPAGQGWPVQLPVVALVAKQ